MDGSTGKSSDPLREQLLKLIANAKYDETLAIPRGTAAGRRLQLAATDRTPAQIKTIFIDQYVDIGRRLGPEMLRNMPAVALEQFVVMAITRDHDSAGLIKSLINSFMVAYLTPETTGRAFDNLVAIEGLREEVARTRRGVMKPVSVAK
ncbi:hypothetical protein [Stutzerimonas stutzeri]|uniref:hypothetical protein n=1 Tax=Stutzerimonas stutzeri TaxID=316 RepID=UPI0015E433C5|nr:hypothetical protein [Stutzerimonas stutzeri]MBA1280333.1 hypothetical protein [Stutzerimonas stutzeri]